MNKHQELRDAIRNLMKEVDEQIGEPYYPQSYDFSNGYEQGQDAALYNVNKKLQAILNAHK